MSINDNTDDQEMHEPNGGYTSQHPETGNLVFKLDADLKKYWAILPTASKKILIALMEDLVLKERPGVVSPAEWEIMIKERTAYVEGKGKTYSREEARMILLSKEKRDELLHRYK